MAMGLCFAIMILSMLWVAMAKGSKFVQEAHEEHIKKFDINIYLPYNEDIKEEEKINLFCDLSKYEDSIKKENGCYLTCALKSARYSPSKINIALGYVSWFVACLALSVHIGFCESFAVLQTFLQEKACIFLTILTLSWILYFLVGFVLRGSQKKLKL
ncbi:RipA family octameric membrane protein [Helicobacter fennelliae]|uniref:RipA family octameric membrane protein n=1 Tax=Helicobacter fennelliae TaxID=215 RepID=UPI00406D4771